MKRISKAFSMTVGRFLNNYQGMFFYQVSILKMGSQIL